MSPCNRRTTCTLHLYLIVLTLVAHAELCRDKEHSVITCGVRSDRTTALLQVQRQVHRASNWESENAEPNLDELIEMLKSQELALERGDAVSLAEIPGVESNHPQHSEDELAVSLVRNVDLVEDLLQPIVKQEAAFQESQQHTDSSLLSMLHGIEAQVFTGGVGNTTAEPGGVENSTNKTNVKQVLKNILDGDWEELTPYIVQICIVIFFCIGLPIVGWNSYVILSTCLPGKPATKLQADANREVILNQPDRHEAWVFHSEYSSSSSIGEKLELGDHT